MEIFDKKAQKRVYDILVKLTNIFHAFYLFKNGYIYTDDLEEPYIVQLEPSDIEYFIALCGEFSIIKVPDIRDFKKSLKEPTKADIEKGKDKSWPKIEDCFYQVTLKSEMDTIVNHLTNKINEINSCTQWENFILSDDKEANMKLLRSLFQDNNYINFKPKDNQDGPDVILTKSLLPLVSEKNYTDLFYASKKVESDLFLIIFDFQFSMFRLFMYHYYIPFHDNYR